MVFSTTFYSGNTTSKNHFNGRMFWKTIKSDAHDRINPYTIDAGNGFYLLREKIRYLKIMFLMRSIWSQKRQSLFGLFDILGGRHVELFAKRFGKIRGITKANFIRNFCRSQAGFQQLCSAL